MLEKQRVAVIGANGHTGRFVLQALKDKGLLPVGLVRRPLNSSSNSEEADVRFVDIGDSASLDRALEGVSAVINCAGPFLDTSRQIIGAALRAKVPYLDLTAEQATVLDIARTCDQLAKSADVVVLPAMAFFGGLADLLASAVMHDWKNADDISVGVALDYWHPTRGTRLTGERNTAPRLVVRGNELVPVPNPPPSRQWDFPEPFGSVPVACVVLSEVITISSHIKVTNLTSYMNDRPLQDLRDQTTPPPMAATASGRSNQNFVMEVYVRRDDRVRMARATGKDIYAVSAPLIVEACSRLLSTPSRYAAGVRSPGDIFNAQDFLASLAPHIVTRYV